ncbi:hypothetical protein ACHAWX_002627 [Stephanocyclus meneghinianus]
MHLHHTRIALDMLFPRFIPPPASATRPQQRRSGLTPSFTICSPT